MITNYTNIGPLVTPKVQSPELSPVKSSQTAGSTDNIVLVEFQQRQQLAEIDLPFDEKFSSEASNIPKETIVELNNSDQVISRNLEFRIDNDTGKTVITVRDTQSQTVIRQIPSEQLLVISGRLKDLQESNINTNSAKGILFTGKT